MLLVRVGGEIRLLNYYGSKEQQFIPIQAAAAAD
jgi:hypothetical protein